MTREEAIKLLTQYIDYDAETPDYYEMERACKVALKVLKQEPCEDSISRAEAMTEIMMFAGNVKSDEEDVYIKVSDAVQLLRELPPANLQESKTGHWKFIFGGTRCCYSDVRVKCNICGHIRSRMDGDILKYCPNCGAKMLPTDLQFADQETLMSAT